VFGRGANGAVRSAGGVALGGGGLAGVAGGRMRTVPAGRVRFGPVLRGNGGRGQASPLQGKLAWLACGRLSGSVPVRS